MPVPRERQRASDHDREQVVDRLHRAATEGRLGPDELDDRLSRAFAAVTYGDLDALTDDLPIAVAPPPPAPQARPARATFGPRLAACAIDAVIVIVLVSVLAMLLHGPGVAVAGVVSAIYFTVAEGGPGGAGVGKRALGLRVVDARTGAPIGYPRAFVRWIGRWISATCLYLGYLWMLGDHEKQCWHDKLAGDVVVHTDGRLELSAQATPVAGALPPRDQWY